MQPATQIQKPFILSGTPSCNYARFHKGTIKPNLVRDDPNRFSLNDSGQVFRSCYPVWKVPCGPLTGRWRQPKKADSGYWMTWLAVCLSFI
jgi:hypothetical protein